MVKKIPKKKITRARPQLKYNEEEYHGFFISWYSTPTGRARPSYTVTERNRNGVITHTVGHYKTIEKARQTIRYILSNVEDLPYTGMKHKRKGSKLTKGWR